MLRTRRPPCWSALLLVLFVPLSGCDVCANSVLDRYRAPDNSVDLVVFVRNCGTTTELSTEASIRQIYDGTRNEAGNIFRATTDRDQAPRGKGGGPEVRVRWIDSRTVELACHRAASVWKRTEHRGVTIRYVTFE